MPDFGGILKSALVEPIGKEEALFLLKKASSWERLIELFRVAAKVRDDEVGSVFKLDGFIGGITACTTEPPCKYCARAASAQRERSEEQLTLEEIEVGSKFVASTSTKRVELGGGTYWQGAGETVLKAVEVVKRTAPSLEVWVNVGPCLTREDVFRLRDSGVKEAGASLETINQDAFRKAKPGDSFEARLQLMKWIEEAGLGLVSVMMVGLPGTTYNDYVDHIFLLSRFKSLERGHLPITGFRPIRGTPFESEPLASPIEVAKVGALARLVLRKCDISFGGMMNDPRLLPLWIMAGANRAIHLGAHVHITARTWRFDYSGEIEVRRYGRLELVNMLALTTRIVKQAGMTPDTEL